MNRRQLRALAVTGALALASLGASSAVSAAPVAKAAKTCSVKGKEQTYGPSYVTSLSVTGVSCGEGEKVVRAYYRCRAVNGPAGRCVRKVRGFACTEQRAGIATQFDARVTCKKRGATVRHSYTQNT
ncbi:hypothetical protein [Conexibacter sp. CPCC 206217]|uniref:hypothetical protein n=1 Tax=Conexibacter sp. CPCC 206217 TaxID=3064574 RepID=UPI00271F7A9E|nr:hypothetical protein [Conexibacter sp. CPCC 206217]MDO8212369.1 hypothetical protein [Conexibacter sp. CPCC 206217]